MAARFPASSSLVRRTLRYARLARPRPHRSAGENRTTMHRRPTAPAYWQNIAPALRAAPAKAGPDRQRHWLLVLQAKGFRYRFFDRSPLPSLYVPPLAAKAALHEILSFERERPVPPLPRPRDRRGIYWYAALLAALIPWHRMRWDGLFAFSWLPATPRDWLTTAGLDAYRVSVTGEWWRAVTSLTLHADAAHLISNLVMGAIFGIPLCRHTGVGFGFFLTIAAGALGNLATAFLRPPSFLSQGFSTAVFASVGLLAAFAAAFAARHAVAAVSGGQRKEAVKQGIRGASLPLGAGLGFLAMLGGSEAPNVDYLAHTMGLTAGIIVGLGVAFFFPRLLALQGKKNAALQWLSLAAAMALILLCWRLALAA